MEFRIDSIVVILFVLILKVHLITEVNGACEWPAEFNSYQWHDSSRGVLTFGTDSVQGYTFEPTSTTSVNSWDCVSVSTYSTDGRMILITSQPFSLFSTNYYAYLCITVTKVTDSSYRYYINHEIQGNVNFERVFIYPVSTLTDHGTICSDSGASGGEYQMLIKTGSESAAKVHCPWHFLGQYGYTHTTSGGTTTCDQTTSQTDMCTDTQQMKFDYSACATKVAYSVSDTLWCVNNVVEGDTNYVMVFNGNDASSVIDDQTIYRFTCMAVSGDVTTASVSPRYCQKDQTPSQYPRTASGQTTGAILSLASPSVTCPTCPVLADPDQGSVSISTTGSLTSALYACAANYTLWGNPSRTCQSDFTWTGTEPACSCETPPTPTNGDVSVNSDGSLAAYSCNVGYTLKGLQNRNCQTSSATWEGDEPTCIQCQGFSTITGQTSMLSTNGTDTSVIFECSSGYTLTGSSSLVCSDDGTWDAQQPNCVSCGTLTNPSSGTVTLSTNGGTSTATYTCASGYTLQGDTTRTCQLDGTWDNSQPTCTCNPPSSPSNGAVVANGVTATYTCNVRFTLDGDVERTCQTDGSGWSSTDPVCSQCAPLSSVTGGAFTTTTTGTVTSAKYTCQEGYSLDGVTTISCQSDGSWSSSPPTCIKCPDLTNPSSGTVSLSTSGTKTSATYACASGYNLNGNTVRLCNSDGTWSLMEPTCTCQSPIAPLNGLASDDGSKVTYTCNQGYSLSGLSTRRCNSDGTGWTGSNPTCNICGTLSSPTGGSVLISTDGLNTQAEYTCNSGYTLNGVSPITCRSDGSWDFTTPTCSKCPDLSDPESGTLAVTSTGSVTTATFTCQTGYYLSGDFILTCGSDGTWSSDVPTCKCNFPTQPSNGQVSVSGTGSVATYSCDTGYSLNGLSARTCQTDGSGWEGSDPACSVCQTVTNPTSGLFSLSSNGTHTSVTYLCDVGTTIDGVSEQVCLDDGSWEDTPPTCVGCPTPVASGSGTVVLSSTSSSTIATFSCVTGYTLNSTSVLTCTSAGTWDNPEPYCICEPPSALTNGDINFSDDLRIVSYTCNVGYVLVGSASRTCRDDGTGWDGINPVCDPSEPDTGASTEGSSLNIPIAALVIVIIIVIILAVLLVVFVHLYCRLRINMFSRVSSPSSREPDDPKELEEKLSDEFTVPKLTGGKASFTNKYTNMNSRPSSASTVALFPNDNTTIAPENTGKKPPAGKVQLPPIGHLITEKRKKKTIGEISSGKKPNARKNRSNSRRGEPRPKTPIERIMTPELLSTVDCSYIKPIYTYELESDAGDRDSLVKKRVRSEPRPQSSVTFAKNVSTSLEKHDKVDKRTPRKRATDVKMGKVQSHKREPRPKTPVNERMKEIGIDGIKTPELLSTVDFTYIKPVYSYELESDSGRNTVLSRKSEKLRKKEKRGDRGLINENKKGTFVTHINLRDGIVVLFLFLSDTFAIQVLCPSLTDPLSGTITLSTSGTQTKAMYACVTGYSLDGNDERLCNSDGTWSLSEPTCECESPLSPLNGLVTDDGAAASYTCNQGYSMNGATTRTCGDDGTGWSGTAPTCSTCDTLSTPPGGTISVSTDGVNTRASYTCNNGYTLNGVNLITCRSDGSWDFTEPTCEKCPELSDPDSGTLAMTSTGSVTMATFTCLSGYYLKGEFSLTCGTDGTWSDDAPSCMCNFPAQPSNGEVSLSGTGTVATYRCDTGYTLTGLSDRTCQNDGTGWEGSEPVCTMCQTLSTPSSGSISFSTNGTQTTSDYACAVGTTLDGKEKIVCNDDGTWDSNQPSCVSCPTLSDPGSGSVSLSTDGLTTSADFSCVFGYTINSTSILTCLSSGTWDLPSPFCICQAPSLVANGQFNISADLLTVTYTCNVGYVLVGSETRTCQNDGTGWDGISPVCETVEPEARSDGATWRVPIAAMIIIILLFVVVVVLLLGLFYFYYRLRKKNTKISDSEVKIVPDEPADFCDPLRNPVGGSVTLSSDGVTTAANYSCIVGYNLVGDSERICQQDKSWSPPKPICVQCDSLSDLSSGDISITSDGYTSTALHTCGTGYYLVGSSERTCQADGSWDGSAPQCDCDPPSSITNGVVTSNGKTANYTCSVGTTIHGLTYRTCNTDGTGWNDGDPQCNPCPPPYTPTGGLYALQTTGTQTFAVYYCERGYTLTGPYKVYCQFTGNWESLPSCVKCDALVSPDSGSYMTTTTGRVTLAIYACNPGYDLNGSNTRTCQPNGKWDIDAPTCTCQSPSGIQNGHVIDDGETANYTCDVGYSLDGAVTRACANDGTGWSGTDPVCHPCDTLTSPTGGSVTMTTDGHVTMVAYSCDVGYTLSGRRNITCRSDGTWTFSEPECVICPTLTIPGSGNVTMISDSQTSTATFSCVTGYYVSGQLTITCQTNGVWDNEPPACKCITPVRPAHGSVSVSDTVTGPVATYQCDLGYSIDGLASRQCQNDGTGWEGTDPTCNICENVITSPELTFEVSTNGSTTFGQYACALNYTLSGEYVHTCKGDGTWDHSAPSCVKCEGKDSPLSGHVIFSTDSLRTRATFSCEQGYDLLSVGVTTCLIDGSWNLPDPLCVCQPPPAIINGDYDLLENGMIANYTCDISYKLVGPRQRLCLTDGTGWNGTEPRCDFIIITTPRTKSDDETVLPIPAAAFVVIFVILIIILVVSIVGSVCWYLRYKKVSQRVGTTFDSSDNKTTSTLDEARFNFESPDIEDGNLLIAKSLEPSKSTFNAKSLKQKSSMSSMNTNNIEEELRSKKSNSDISLEMNQNGCILNDPNTPPHVPLSAVRLPKLPPKAPRKSKATKVKRKRRRVERSEDATDVKDPKHSDEGTRVKEPKPRTSTPIEVAMSRTKTPDMLASEEFAYIQPVFCHEVDTPTPSRPTTSTSRYTIKNESNV